ncbi:DUF2202 domain-containing protein [Gemmatimonas phototrophica]|uniref:DUF2202 domain-containing protein n=1 Tax=Gemmatimonas phototrophica TaxID=1379270 RepID=UPI001313E2C5|nr:DUF2202 domain-containing protein [Gemmatimonas phototrophica]
MFLAACNTTATAPAVAPALAANVVAAIDTTLQDERHAESIYLRVLADHGNVLPFFNIVVAEQRHSASLEALLRGRGLPVAESPWTLDNVPRFPSVREACAAAATAEVDNVALYDRFLSFDLPADVRQVFTANRRASIEKHLPAFQLCR